MEIGLFVVSVVCDLVLATAVVLFWRRSAALAPSEVDFGARAEELSSRVEERLEAGMAVVLERLDSLRDDVRFHGLQQRSQGDRATERAGEAPDPRYEDSSTLRAPPADRERYEDPYDEQQLESLLGSPEFRDGVWPRMDGTFQMASAHLCGFLASQGFPEPGVEPHPPLVRGEGNHWDFLVVRARRAGEEGRRFLVPRNYSRYDPAMHDHLFDVLGRGASLESFVRELRRCAVLRGSGDLGELIRPELLARKGVFVV